MASFTITVTPNSAITPVEGYRVSELGRLKSVAVVFVGPTTDWGRVYVQVGSMVGGRGMDYVGAMFYNGYVSRKHLGMWNGDYPFDPYEEIFVYAWAMTTRTIRVTGKIEIGDP
jgi:hypothetical protein